MGPLPRGPSAHDDARLRVIDSGSQQLPRRIDLAAGKRLTRHGPIGSGDVIASTMGWAYSGTNQISVTSSRLLTVHGRSVGSIFASGGRRRIEPGATGISGCILR